MNVIRLSAVLTAALLTGAVSATALAAEVEPAVLPVTDASIAFKKGISLENAPGAGGIQGSIAFAVSPAQQGDLPPTPEDGAQLGTVDQIKTGTVTAAFTVDDTGVANADGDVTVDFDLTKFTTPGVYYYRLTEQDHGITGLSTAPVYLLKVRVVNTTPSDPENTELKIDYAVLAPQAGGDKVDEIENVYTTYGLTVTKQLAGNFADYGDEFAFTLHFDDPDETAHMASVTVKTGKAGETLANSAVLKFVDGKADITETIKGGEVIEVTGLPAGTTYTITESGTDAANYTTAWTDAAGASLGEGKALDQQTMPAADTALIVTNTRNAATPTGLLLDVAPYGAMLALAAGSGAVFFRKRRHTDR